jgi:hypothetical protein
MAYMRNLLVLFSLFAAFHACAQDYVAPLNFNPRLYYSTAGMNKHVVTNRYKDFTIVEDSNILVETDTLNLPFVDDFTYNLLRPYSFSQYIYDTVYNAIGPCDTTFGVSVVSDTFNLNPTFRYVYDTALKQIDTIPNAPILFLNSPGFTGGCFYNAGQPGDSAILYPIGYLYVFDTITGETTDSIPDSTDVPVGITYAPVLYKAKIPAYTQWLDNNAYQNYTSGYLPPSLGVATFDGLNGYGQPYSPDDPTAIGYADVLTSKPVNLGGLTDADSIYLSFFYQPGGNGYGYNDPLIGDSLILQFYNGYTNTWDELWSVTGDSVPPAVPDAFQQVILRIPSTSITPAIEYIDSGFQFRFVNYGSLYGLNTVWNLDYVRLDKDRNFVDTSINDLAFQYQFPSILRNFTEMPAEQFTGLADLSDSVPLTIDNLNANTNNPPATSYSALATETYPTSAVLLQTTSGSFNAEPENFLFLRPDMQYSAPVGGPFVGANDSLAIISTAAINGTDILPANDTVSHTQILSNTLAYDDGTAELAYGLQLGAETDEVLKFAYDYTLNSPDTLVGYQVLYTYSSDIVNDLTFNFNIWYTLDTMNVYYTDSAVWTSNNDIPIYIDSVNGFATYTIPPFPLPTHFYFGWAQTDVRNTQIGFDVNSTKGRPHMYVYDEGIWQLSTLPIAGSPMIRLLLGHTYQVASGIKNVAVNPIKAYPNPTTGVITFDLPNSDTYQLELYSSLGQLSLRQTLFSGDNQVNISNLEQGMYLIRLTDSQSGITYQNKIVRSPQ